MPSISKYIINKSEWNVEGSEVGRRRKIKETSGDNESDLSKRKAFPNPRNKSEAVDEKINMSRGNGKPL